MEPLKSWICDFCHELIAEVDDGWLEWLDDSGKGHGFKIVHHKTKSPRANGCYHYDSEPRRMDMHLEWFTSSPTALLAKIDPGPRHEPTFSGPWVKDLREWAEIFRRLFIPFYEEARLYWGAAEVDGYFDGANEVLLYSPDFLKELIDTYGQTDGEQ